MNRKLMLGGVLGLVAFGAGALALTTFGSSDSGDSPAGRRVHAAYAGSYSEPLVFTDGGGYLPSGPSLGEDIKVARATGPAAPATGHAAPAASSGPATTQPEEDEDAGAGSPAAEDEDDDTTATPAEPATEPTIPQGGGNGNGNDGNGNGLIFSEKLNDAICELLGCNPPQMPNIPGLSDAICDASDCDEDAGMIEPKLDPCAVLGNCPKPPVIDIDIRPRR